MNKKNTKLDVEIDRLYDRLQTLEPDTDEYAKVEDAYTKLRNLKLEIEKHESDKKDRWCKHGLDATKTILTLAVTVGGSLLAWQIEAHGGSGVPFNFGKRFVEKLTKY
jgi:hypothetical protein